MKEREEIEQIPANTVGHSLFFFLLLLIKTYILLPLILHVALFLTSDQYYFPRCVVNVSIPFPHQKLHLITLDRQFFYYFFSSCNITLSFVIYFVFFISTFGRIV